MGRDKASGIIGGKCLLEWVVDAVASLDGDIMVVTAVGQSFPGLEERTGLQVLTDIYPGKGPLGGIYTGLKASRAYHNIVVACDMPFLKGRLLRHMADVAEGFDMVLPRLGEMVEPLCAVYSKGCLAPIEILLGRGELRLRGLLPMVKVRYLEEEEIDRFDPEHLSFFNVNNNSDMERAESLARSEL